MKKRRSKITVLLILSSFIFSGSICLFVFGYLLQRQTDLSLKLVCISFVVGIISGVSTFLCKFRIDNIIEYGKPIFVAAQQIKEIIEASNIFGVEQLHNIVEAAVKGKLKEIIKKAKEENKGKGQ